MDNLEEKADKPTTLEEDSVNVDSAAEKEEEDTDSDDSNSEELVAETKESPDLQEEDQNADYQALNDKYLRLYAEFENFRKRSARETLELIQTANAEILEKLIPVLEDFARAFSRETKAKKLEDFESGIQMIYNSFKDVLEDAGLEEIDPGGEEFDPNLHEALMEQPHDSVEEGWVIQVFQKGYKIKSKILKHAKVIISKGPEKKNDK